MIKDIDNLSAADDKAIARKGNIAYAFFVAGGNNKEFEAKLEVFLEGYAINSLIVKTEDIG